VSLLDWASRKVQGFTGESDRRELVAEFKEVHSNHKSIITRKVKQTNQLIQEFNKLVKKLNIFRKKNVKEKIDNLYKFLKKFGNIEATKSFSYEEEKGIITIPEKKFELTEDYIEDIDWGKDDVFKKTFFKTLLGVRAETKRQNLSMKEELNEYRLEIISREKQVDMKQQRVKTDIQIGDLYYNTIEIIDNTIQEKILPEMELVEAMLEAESIKNLIIANQEVTALPVKKDISLLKGTIYERHYQFIKNSFLFFILCKKVYNTSVLTRLLNDKTTSEDYKQIENQKLVLIKQNSELTKNMMRGA
jgi:hypothetical protein